MQLARFLGEFSPDPDADEAAQDPCAVTRAHVEAFQGWMIETRSASTALNKHKGLQQFFRWLCQDEQDIARSPMERVAQPRTPQKLIPLLSADDTAKLLATCRGREFLPGRDEAIIRLYCATGARLSEVGNLLVDDVDLGTDSVRYWGKGNPSLILAVAHRGVGLFTEPMQVALIAVLSHGDQLGFAVSKGFGLTSRTALGTRVVATAPGLHQLRHR